MNSDRLGAAFRLRQRAEGLSDTLPPLLLAAMRVAATVTQGVHGRRRVGMGETFWQFRRYQAGDSLTSIDWRQSARNDQVFVRQNEWEAAQTVWLWCDRSPSMAYRSVADLPTKRERAELLTLALAVLLVGAGERVALINLEMRPSAGRGALERFALKLADAPAESERLSLPGRTALPRHSQTVLIGDFLAPLPETQALVGGLIGHEVRGHLLQVLDPAEELLPFEGRITFTGLEGERPLILPRVESVREAYRERLEAHREGLRTLARTAGWTFSAHSTDRPPEPAMLALYQGLALRSGPS